MPISIGLRGYPVSDAFWRGDRLPPGERPTLCRRCTESPSRFGIILILGSGGLRLVVQRANYVVMYDRWLAVSISIASAIGWALKGRTRFAPGKV